MSRKGKEDESPPTIGEGLFLLLVITVCAVVAGLIPVRHIALDLTGAGTPGRVVDRATSCIGGWNTGIRCFKSSVYTFQLEDGRKMKGKGFLEGAPLPDIGSTVRVRYLPFWPEINNRAYVHWKNWIFWLFLVGFLILLWLWFAMIGKLARLMRDGHL